jgi:hypothetical protein
MYCTVLVNIMVNRQVSLRVKILLRQLAALSLVHVVPSPGSSRCFFLVPLFLVIILVLLLVFVRLRGFGRVGLRSALRGLRLRVEKVILVQP